MNLRSGARPAAILLALGVAALSTGAQSGLAPTGWLDGIDTADYTLSGWTYDPDSPSQSILVHVYVSTTTGQWLMLGVTTADLYREDVNVALGITGNHGYSFSIPPTYRVAGNDIYTYGVDSATGLVYPLAGCPKTVQVYPVSGLAPGLPPDQASPMVTTPTPTIRWEKQAGVTQYLVALVDYTPEGNGALLLDQWYQTSSICAGSQCSVLSPALTHQGVHYLNVYNGLAWDPTGRYFSFQMPPVTLIGPTGTLPTPTPTFTWNQQADIASFCFWLYNDTSGHNSECTWYPASSVCNGSTCSVAPGQLETGHGRAFRWSVWNGFAWAAWSYVTVAGDTVAPTTALSAPVPGASLTGTVTLAVAAADNVGVTKVEVYDGSTLLNAQTGSAMPGSAFDWDTTRATPGGHTLTSKAYDWEGNVTASTGVNVTVDNVNLALDDYLAASGVTGSDLYKTAFQYAEARGLDVFSNPALVLPLEQWGTTLQRFYGWEAVSDYPSGWDTWELCNSPGGPVVCTNGGAVARWCPGQPEALEGQCLLRMTSGPDAGGATSQAGIVVRGAPVPVRAGEGVHLNGWTRNGASRGRICLIFRNAEHANLQRTCRDLSADSWLYHQTPAFPVVAPEGATEVLARLEALGDRSIVDVDDLRIATGAEADALGGSLPKHETDGHMSDGCTGLSSVPDPSGDFGSFRSACVLHDFCSNHAWEDDCWIPKARPILQGTCALQFFDRLVDICDDRYHAWDPRRLRCRLVAGLIFAIENTNLAWSMFHTSARTCGYSNVCGNCAPNTASCGLVAQYPDGNDYCGTMFCSDGTCDTPYEDASTCPQDCEGSTGGGGCNDHVCSGGETCATCALDCGECPSGGTCGDRACNNGETCASCVDDCAGKPDFTVEADNLTVTLRAVESTLAPGSVRLWDMGNTQHLQGEPLTYTYPAGGSYRLILTATEAVCHSGRLSDPHWIAVSAPSCQAAGAYCSADPDCCSQSCYQHSCDW